MKHFRAAIAALLLVLLVAGCTVSRNPISGRQRAYGYTWEQEKQLGQQADQQILQQYGVYDDPELEAYVRQVGERVLAESHLRRPETPAEFRDIDFTFRVLDSPIVNAFALPGGYIYVTRGLLTHLENEAQLAVVLGHEITHVAARHASKRAAEAQLGQLGLLTGAILGQAVLGGSAAENILNLGSQGLQLLFLSYGRDDERESDTHGVEYAALAGYEAGEGAAFFESLERLSAQQGGGLPSWLSTHPDPGEREAFIQERAAQWAQQVDMTVVDRDEYLRQIEGVVLGENPRQGFVQNDRFYHPELRFQYPVPRGFVVDNQHAQVVMADPDGQAVLLFTDASLLAGAQVSSARDAATRFAQQQGLQVLESGPSTAGGQSAYYVLADAQLQSGQTVRLLTYFVEQGGQTWGFLGYADTRNFSAFQDTFLRSMRGFAPLTDPGILNVQPARVNLVAAERSAPFRSFVPASLPNRVTAEDLAILNQVELTETIQAGRLLKLPAR